jgi:hypothetical protein
MRKLTSFLPIYLCVALSLGARPQSTSLESFVPSPSQVFYLDLDTAEGSFSQWRHEGLASLSALSATIRVPRLRNDRKWDSTFGIWLQDAGIGEERRRLGVRLTAPRKKPPLGIQIIQTDKRELISSETLPIEVGLDENLTVGMVWATPHSVTITVGERETRTIPLLWLVESIAVTASTGQMKIDPLVLGTVRSSRN